MGFEFHWPWLIVLMLVPVLVRLFWPMTGHRGGEAAVEDAIRQQTLLHPSLDRIGDGFGSRTRFVSARGPWHTRLSWVLWTALVMTLMRPQWVEQHTETRAKGYDLMMAIDASHSMEALDFSVEGRQVTRMAVLKGVVDQFITDRTGDRIGLIVFGSQAYTIAPLTFDIEAVRNQLAAVAPNIAGQGTAMGDAIGLGVLKLRDRPKGSRVLILVADGDNSAGTIPPLEAARMAAHENIRVYVLGVGSDEKTVEIFEEGQVVRRDDLGLDEGTLRDVARLSGGAYFRATNTHALEEIYAQIGRLEKSLVESRSVLIPHSLHQVPLAVALLAALLLGLFPEGRIRLPRWSMRVGTRHE
ncbi:VWA domain-containing protein [Magnetospira thiophila]